MPLKNINNLNIFLMKCLTINLTTLMNRYQTIVLNKICSHCATTLERLVQASCRTKRPPHGGRMHLYHHHLHHHPADTDAPEELLISSWESMKQNAFIVDHRSWILCFVFWASASANFPVCCFFYHYYYFMFKFGGRSTQIFLVSPQCKSTLLQVKVMYFKSYLKVH